MNPFAMARTGTTALRAELDDTSSALARSNQRSKELSREVKASRGWGGRTAGAGLAAIGGGTAAAIQTAITDTDGTVLGILPGWVAPLVLAAVTIPLAVVSESDAVASAGQGALAASVGMVVERGRETAAGIARVRVLDLASHIGGLDAEKRQTVIDALHAAGIRHAALGDRR